MKHYDEISKIEESLGVPFMHTVLSNSSACIIVAEAPSGKVLYINDAVRVFRGETDAPLDGILLHEYVLSWKEFAPDGTQLNSEDMPLARAIMKDEVIINEEVIVELDTGERRWALASAAPIKDRQGLTIAGIVSWIDITEYKQQKEHLEQARRELYSLRKLIPICSHCKKVRNDEGYWNQVEVYLREHFDAECSHGICPDCARELYPDVFDKE